MQYACVGHTRQRHWSAYMAQPTYIPTHRKLLTKAQASDFITALNSAKYTADAEKAVEDAVNTLLTTGLSKLHGTPTTLSLIHI